MAIGIPPTFQRGPRQLLADLGLNVDIPAPPPPPRAPEGPALSNLLVPLGVTSAGMGAIYAATSASNDFQPLYLLATVPMLLASSGVSLWNSLVEGRAYRRKAAERSVTYRATLAELDRTLGQQIAEQRLA